MRHFPQDFAPRISRHRGYSSILILGLIFLLGGCKEPEVFVKAGQPFTEEKAPPSKAVVYIYWPAEKQGRPKQLWVGLCDGSQGEILPGGYTSFVVNPGPGCFRAERSWDMTSSSWVSENLGEVKLTFQPGHAAFVRLERRKGFFTPGFGLRTMSPEAAKPEIGKCRQTVPFSTDEIFRATERIGRL